MRRSGNLPMVRWYSPRQLLRTGAEIVAARVVVRLLDRRTIPRRQPDPAKDTVVLGDWKRKREIWIDYVADWTLGTLSRLHKKEAEEEKVLASVRHE